MSQVWYSTLRLSSCLQNGVTKTIIPEENSIIRSVSFFNVGGHESLIVSKGDEIIMYNALDENGRSKSHQPISIGRVCICVVDKETIACVSIWPNALGDHEIHLVDINENNWQVRIIPGGTRSGNVQVCEAGPPDPLPPSIRNSLKKTNSSIRSAV